MNRRIEKGKINPFLYTMTLIWLCFFERGLGLDNGPGSPFRKSHSEKKASLSHGRPCCDRLESFFSLRKKEEKIREGITFFFYISFFFPRGIQIRHNFWLWFSLLFFLYFFTFIFFKFFFFRIIFFLNISICLEIFFFFFIF